MDKKLLVLTIFCALIALTSCQKTPSEKSVVGKNGGILENAIQGTDAPPKKYEAPSQWLESFEIKKEVFEVSVGASIEVPEVESFPVYLVAPKGLSQEDAYKYTEILMQGKPIYEPKAPSDKTKSEYNDEILSLKKAMSDPNSDLNILKAENPSGYQQALKYCQNRIAELEGLKEKAPDTYERKEASGKFESGMGDSGTERFFVEADFGDNTAAQLFAIKYKNHKNDKLSFLVINKNRVASGALEAAEDNIKGMQNSLGYYVSAANSFIEKLGLSSMYIAAEGSMPYASFEETSLASSYEDLNKCYTFYYTRKLDGIQQTYSNTKGFMQPGKTEMDYAEAWPDEWIEISIADYGVVSFRYQSPITIKEKVSNNVALLPFEQIKERFLKQIEMSGSYTGNEQIVSRKLFIDKIVLGYARIPIKNRPNESLMAPVWDFYGTCIEKYSDGVYDSNFNENNEYVDDTFCHSYLTINAIDGSVVERVSDL